MARLSGSWGYYDKQSLEGISKFKNADTKMNNYKIQYLDPY